MAPPPARCRHGSMSDPSPVPAAPPPPPPAPSAPSAPVPPAPIPAATAAAGAIDATKIYGRGESQVVALDNVTVTFEKSRYTAIMGPSGSGKSTLMHCLA